MRRWSPVVVLGALQVLAGCGDSGGDSDADADVVFADVATVPVEEVCELRARVCCFIELCLSGSLASPECVKVHEDACTQEIIGPLGLLTGGSDVSYDPKRAGTCLAHYLDGACEDLDAITGGPPAECLTVFTGLRAEGEVCASDIACEPGLFCMPGAGGECPGTCAPRRALGETCDGDLILCADGLTCSSRTGPGSCVPATVAAGGECVPELFSQCPLGYRCDAGSDRCILRAPAGEPCPLGVECDFASYCDFDADVCVAIPQLGEDCDLTCGGGSVCDQTTHKCTAFPTAAGQPCVDASFGCGFRANLYCDTATDLCATKLPPGSPCGADLGTGICDYGYCDGDFATRGVCRGYKSAGDACGGFEECGPLPCEDGVCRVAPTSCRGVVHLTQCYF